MTSEIIENYKNQSRDIFSPSSLERHLSSLRKFFNFLKLEGTVAHSPFERLGPGNQKFAADPYRIKDFKNYLYVYNASHLTIKNYLIDIKQFFVWAETVTTSNNPLSELNSKLIEEYKQRLLDQGSFSPSTINRKLSSLRKYLSWAILEGLVHEPSFTVDQLEAVREKVGVKDNRQAKAKSYSNFPPLRLAQKISNLIILASDGSLIIPLAKLVSKVEYGLWKNRGYQVFTKLKTKDLGFKKQIGPAQSIFNISNIKKEFYAPLEISTKNFPWYKKAWFTARYNRPKWYRTYHSYSIVHYFHFTVLIIFLIAVGFGFYNTFFQKGNQTPTLAQVTSPARILSFQGRLTDNFDNPITTGTSLRFAIYNSLTATGSALLWQETDYVTPDTDGIFSLLLGKNTSIPTSLFADHSELWLGVSVNTTPELTPRQQIATVAYAANAQTLEGLLPIVSGEAGQTNVVLALDSSGNLTIGGTATPIFQATGGQFTLLGQPLLLGTNAGSNSNVTIAPDGLGQIDLQKPLQNSTNNNNITTATGAVEVDDLFAILATSSGQSALTINQDSTGPLISASTSGVERFTVDSLGNVKAAGTTTFGGVTYTWPGSIGGNNYVLQTQTNGTLEWVAQTGGTGGGFWQELTGALSPVNIGDDLLLGSTATESAPFAFTGLMGNQTQASFSGQLIVTPNNGYGGGIQLGSTINNNNVLNTIAALGAPSGDLYWGNRQIIDSTNIGSFGVSSVSNSDGTLTISPTTGTVIASLNLTHANTWSGAQTFQANTYFPNNGIWDTSGNVGIGTTSPLATLDVRGNLGTVPVASISGNTSFASLVVNNDGGGDLFTASSSGWTRFRIDNNGNLTASGNGNFSGNLTVGGTTTFGGIAYNWPTTIADNNYILKAQTNGTLAWVASGALAGTNFWQNVQDALSPIDTTYDLLLGSNATSTAKFAFTGLYGNQTQASFSGQMILMADNGYGGMLGIGNTNPSVALDVRNALGKSTIASISGQLIVMGNGGWGGQIGIGTINPAGMLDINQPAGGGTTINFSSTTSIQSGGTGIKFGTNGVNGGTGINLSVVTSGTGITTGFVNSSATGIKIGGSSTGASAFTGKLLDLTQSRTYNGGAPTETGIFLNVIRSQINTSGNTLTMSGDLADLSSNCTETSGGCIDTSHVLSLTQNYTKATGSVLDIRNLGNGLALNAISTGNTTSVASISGKTSFASLVVNNDGVGDLITASASGWTRFRLDTSGNLTTAGNLVLSNNTSTTTFGGIVYTWPTSIADNNYILRAQTDGTLAWVPQATAVNFWQDLTGALSPVTNSDDLLLGSSATSTAKFAFTGLMGNQTQASFSGQFIVVPDNGYGGGIQLGSTINNNNVLNTSATAGAPSGDLYWGNTQLLDVANLSSFGVASISNSDGTLTISPTSGAVVASLNLGNANSWSGAQTFQANTYFPNNGVWDTTGKVGIGTTPSVALDVVGAGKFSTDLTASTGTILLANTSGNVTIGNATGTLVLASNAFNVTIGGAVSGVTTLSMNNQLTNSYANSAAINLTGNGSGITFGGTGTNQIITGAGNNLALMPGGNLGINTTTPAVTLDVRGNSGTSAVASISGNTSFASLVVNNDGVGDLITASSSGWTRFRIDNNGNLTVSGTTTFGGIAYTWPSSIDTNGYILQAQTNGTLSWVSPTTLTITQFWQELTGALSPVTSSDDLLLGSSATSTAKFAFTGLMGNQTQASFSGQMILMADNGYGGMLGIGTINPTASLDVAGNASVSGTLAFRAGAGNIQTTAFNTLNIGGTTTGNIVLAPFNGGLGASVAPSTNGNVDLGTSTSQWRNIYANGLILPTTATIDGFWQRNSGALIPTNITDDLLLGTTTALSTASAQFSVSGIAKNQATASLSGQLIVIGNKGWGGNIGLNTTTPGAKIDISNAATDTGIRFINAFGGSAAGTGIKFLSTLPVNTIDSLATGINIGGVAGSGIGISMGNGTTTGGNTFTGAYLKILATHDYVYPGAIPTSGNYILLSRSESNSAGGGTVAVSGDLASFTSTCVSHCTDTSHVLSLTQNFLNATGSVLDIRNLGNGIALNAFSVGNTTSVASISGKTSFASLVVNNDGGGDLITASASSWTRFRVDTNGNLTANGTGLFSSNLTTGGNLVLSNNTSTTTFGGIVYTWPTGGQSNGYVLTTNGSGSGNGTLSWVPQATAVNFWQDLTGALSPVTSSDDLLLGSSATSTAKFAFTGLMGNQTQASFSGQLVVVPDNGYGGGIQLGSTVNNNNVLNTSAAPVAPSGNLYWGNRQLVDSTNISNFGVSSISNSDGTLTISPTSGAVVASLNLGNANSWSGAQTFQANTYFPNSGIWDTSGKVGIGTTPSVALDVVGAGKFSTDLTASTGTILLANTSGNVTIGNGSGTLVLASNAFNVTIGGAVSGVTTLGMNNQLSNSYANTAAINLTGNASGITFGGTGTNQIITGAGNNLALMPGGNLGINTTTPAVTLDVRGNLGTSAVASISGNTSFAPLVVNNDGVGDLLTASSSGWTRFRVDTNGNLTVSGTTTFGGIAYTWPGSIPANGYVLQAQTNGTLSWVYLPNFWQELTGALSPIQSGDDLLLGSSATSTAKFAFTGLMGNQTQASFSGQMILMADNGYGGMFGIGTTTPSVALDVVGAGKFSTDLTASTGNISLANTSGNVTIGNGSGTLVLASNAFNVTIGGAVSGVTTLGMNNQLSNSYANTAAINLTGNASGITFGGTGTNQIITGAGNNLALMPGGNLGINTTTPAVTLDVRGNLGTSAVASISGNTSFAPLVVNNDGVGDLLTASSSGTNKFAVKGTGQLLAPLYNSCTLKTDGSGLITCGTDLTGNTVSFWQELIGALSPVNTGDDLLLGSSATASAPFAFTGLMGNQTQASFSGQLVLMPNNGYGGMLGIGTTNPLALLSVGSSSQFQVNSLGAISAATGITSSGTITLSGFPGANNGGVIYANSAGVLSQTGAGTSATCLVGGTTPTWSSCSQASSNFWQEITGALSPIRSTDDLLIGSSATSTAKFAFTGLNSNQTQASFSGQFIVMPDNGYGGNVGIGKMNPSYSLDVAGVGNFYNLASNELILGTSSASIVNAFKGFNGYTNFSGGIGTGGVDSILGAQRLTSQGNLVNIGFYQGGEMLLTRSTGFAAKVDYPTDSRPAYIVIGDLNGDGKADVAMTHPSSDEVSVCLNNGDGTFAACTIYPAGVDPVYIAIGDLNGDGKADLAVANWDGGSGNTVSVLINNGNGTFGAPQSYTTGLGPRGIAIGDLNGDGKADLAVTNSSGSTVSVLMNKGNGTFAAKQDYTTGTFPENVAIGDLNGDGKADLAVTNFAGSHANTVSVLMNNGNGTFAAKQDYPTGTNPLRVAIADFNGDGKADLAVTSQDGSGNTLSVFMNNGDGTFAARQDYTTNSSATNGLSVGDVNGDGKPDIAVSNTDLDTISVFLNKGDGTFTLDQSYPTGHQPQDVAMGDLSGDGKADLVSAYNILVNGYFSVFLNQTSPMLYAQSSTGRVGIGLSSTPSAMLDVRGIGLNSGTLAVASVSGNTSFASLVVNNDGSGDLFTASSSGWNRFVIQNNGNVGIGTTTPGAKLEVVGDIISKGTSWISQTSAADNPWYSVTYGNGLFVAVAKSSSSVMISPDGINWTTQTAPSANWQAVTYGNGLFVAVGDTGGIMTSPDGINWTTQIDPVGDRWDGITYGNGRFVAVAFGGGGSHVMTSPDGINWTAQTAAASEEWTSVTYGNGLFVAVADTGTGDRVMTSPDGITWTSRTSAADEEWASVTYGNGLFVAVAKTGTGDRVMTSTNGSAWTSRTSAADDAWRSVTYGDGLFVAVAASGTIERVMTSPDGINWTSRTSAADNQWRSVTYGNGLFVAVSLDGTGNRVMTSGKTDSSLIATNNIYQGGMSIFGNVGIGTTAPLVALDVRGNSGITPVASVSGNTSFASLVVNNDGVGDLFTASASGWTRFRIDNNGNLLPGATNAQNIGSSSLQWRNIYATGLILPTTATLDGFWQRNSGALIPTNITDDFLLGTTTALSTASAQFSVSGIAKNQATASLSGQLIVMANNGWGGNVGIGKTTTLAKLDIKDTNSVASIGTEKITAAADINFSSDTGDWTTSGSPPWKINIASSGVAAKDAPGTGALTLSNSALNSGPVANHTYQITLDYTTTASSSGYLLVSFGGTSGGVGLVASDSETSQSQIITAAGADPLTFTPSNDNWYGTIDNISVKEVTTSSIALRLEPSDGTSTPIEFRTGGSDSHNIFIGQSSGMAATSGSYNTAVGNNALRSNTTGDENSAFGPTALYSNTTGFDNSAFGYTALGDNSTGGRNNAFGRESLSTNVSGSFNDAFGYGALEKNVNGSYNEAFGSQSLHSNTTGNQNVAIGNSAGYSALGSGNVFIGSQAGYSALGSGNVFIGNGAGYTETGDNKLYIANTSGTPLIYGDFNAGEVGVNTATPRSPLDVLSTGGTQLRLTYTDNSVYTTFNTDSSGNLTIDVTGTKTIIADNLQVTGNITPTTDNTYNLGSSPSGRFKSLFLGGGSLHIQCLTTDSGCPSSQNIDYAFQIDSAGTLGIGANLNSGSTPTFNITQGGRLGIATINPAATLDISNTSGVNVINLANAMGSATGININIGPTTGQGIAVGAGAITSGTAIIIKGGGAGTLSSFTGKMLDISPSRTHQGATAITDSGNFIKVARSDTINNASGTFNITGDLASFSSNCTLTAGSCTDTSHILSLTQSFANATGSVLYISNSGNGIAMDVRSTGNTTSVASISGQTSFAGLVVDNSGAGDLITASSSAHGNNPSRTEFRVDNSGNVYGRTWEDLDNSAYYMDLNTSGTSILTGGAVGVKTTSPRAPLDVLSTAGTQLRLTYTDNSVYTNFNTDSSGNLTIDATGTKTIIADNLQVTGNSILDSGAVTRIGLGDTTTLTNTTLTLSGTTTLTASTLNAFTTSATLALNGASTINTNQASLTLFNTTATTLNFAQAATAINMGAASGVLTLGSNSTINGGSAANDDLTLQGTSNGTRTTSYVLLQPTAGNVGIGTTTPNAMLDIEGTSANAGQVLIGTGSTTSGNIRFQVTSSFNSTASAQIWNAFPNAGGNAACTGTSCHVALNLKLGNNIGTGGVALQTLGTFDRFINFSLGNSLIIGKLAGNGSGSVSLSSTGGDYAEYFKKANSDEIINPGDLVCINSSGLVTKCDSNNSTILGVASNSYIVLGNDKEEYDGNPDYVVVGLLGQIKTYVNSEGGAIQPGDLLTYSSTPGVAKKATGVGFVIGRATEGGTSGRINVYVNPTWYDPQVYLTTTGDLNLVDQNAADTGYTVPHYFTLNDALGNPVNRVGEFSDAAIANLRVGLVNAQQVTTNALNVATENITINGQNIRDYIASIVSEQLANYQNLTSNSVISPIASVDEIHTNFVSPIDNNAQIGLKLDNNKLSVLNGNSASSSAVATIDNQGNATFSGQLSSNSLNTNEATISGTLHAGKIIADQIEGLNVQASTVSAQYITNVTNVYNSTGSSSFPTLVASPSSMMSSLYGDNYLDISSFSGQLAYIENLGAATAMIDQNLMVFGSTALSDTSIVGQLSINGSLILANNSINTLGSDLNLQPLRQGGLSVMAGLFYIDTNGNVKVGGNAEFAKDVTIKGTLAAGVISPLPGNDLAVNLGENNSSLVVHGASNSAVLSVNQNGDLVASGAGTFAKLNLNLVQPALAVSPTEVVATGSAGTASITPYQTQVTIDNSLVTDKSLIYITPTSNTNNQVLYLLKQVPDESFTVGIQDPSQTAIPFNWMIVN